MDSEDRNVTETPFGRFGKACDRDGLFTPKTWELVKASTVCLGAKP
jgi:hypothetical protein